MSDLDDLLLAVPCVGLHLERLDLTGAVHVEARCRAGRLRHGAGTTYGQALADGRHGLADGGCGCSVCGLLGVAVAHGS
jgi:hypothetical protein